MPDLSDADLQLKKRARRRLVGAAAFAGLVAVVLPMVMDEEPKQQVQDVQISIPGQERTPFKPRLEPAGDETKEAPAWPAEPTPPSEKPAPKPAEPVVKPVETPKPAEPPKPAAKPVETPKPAPKPVETPKPAPKPAEKPVERQTEAQRAAAILSGRIEGVPAPGANVPFVILIGAFSNPVNVRILQTKLGELGVKMYTEPLDSPGGRKTRVRAGPFDSRAAAEKALAKMKRIGVNGVVAAKQ
ncbi:MAG: SPOR domain-containing protein [Candidatus Accumulibacter sp.]|jgi:DedD protein|nr:SPOR domain-containing protein [Accumulibacter sp.]